LSGAVRVKIPNPACQYKKTPAYTTVVNPETGEAFRQPLLKEDRIVLFGDLLLKAEEQKTLLQNVLTSKKKLGEEEVQAVESAEELTQLIDALNLTEISVDTDLVSETAKAGRLGFSCPCCACFYTLKPSEDLQSWQPANPNTDTAFMHQPDGKTNFMCTCGKIVTLEVSEAAKQ
jgi:hypothetical protein